MKPGSCAATGSKQKTRNLPVSAMTIMVILRQTSIDEKEAIGVRFYFLLFAAIGRPGNSAMFHLYENGTAIGRRARQRPERRYTLPGFYPACYHRVPGLSLVEK
jgi:hypothetical protein